MKLAVSNIAWANEEEADIAPLLQKLGVRYVEIAPTKQWDNPTLASQAGVDAYKAFWQSYGIEIVAFQSMLFNQPELKLFETDELRTETLEYLQDFIRLAGQFGATKMVFGSPKNRQKGDLSTDEALEIAIVFFETLGKTARQYGTVFCIEPNAPQYNCDFITNAQQGIDIVKAVNNPGFGLHLDAACMALAGDSLGESIKAAAEALQHYHISSPMLEQVEARDDVDHTAAAQALRDIGYDKFVSIEMRPGTVGENAARVKKAVEFAQAVYSS